MTVFCCKWVSYTLYFSKWVSYRFGRGHVQDWTGSLKTSLVYYHGGGVTMTKESMHALGVPIPKRESRSDGERRIVPIP